MYRFWSHKSIHIHTNPNSNIETSYMMYKAVSIPIEELRYPKAKTKTNPTASVATINRNNINLFPTFRSVLICSKKQYKQNMHSVNIT